MLSYRLSLLLTESDIWMKSKIYIYIYIFFFPSNIQMFPTIPMLGGMQTQLLCLIRSKRIFRGSSEGWIFKSYFTVCLSSHLTSRRHHHSNGRDVAGTGHTSQSRAQRQLAKTPSQVSRPHTRLRIPRAIIKPPGRCSSKVNTVHRGCADLRGFDPRGVTRTSALFGFIQHHLS